jgi:hypothetical protein
MGFEEDYQRLRNPLSGVIYDTGWSVAKIDKLTNTVDANHWKMGHGHFYLQLKDSNNEIHKLSAYGVASGFTTKEGFLTDPSKLAAQNREIGENFLKDILKYFNPAKVSTANPTLYWIDNPAMHNRLVDDKVLSKNPNVKSFTSCSLNLFSIKLKATFGMTLEGSFDVYAFIAGHHFIPYLTSYVFVTKSVEVPLWDTYKSIIAGPERDAEFVFVQYYCPFVGMDSTSVIDSGISMLKDIHDGNKKIFKKLKKLPGSAWRPLDHYY